ncbi:ATP synthase subunit C lysine N-methyltransferase-like [Uloborus diversus]|uniref:ATP synthase subunit C lysine N-methyltransferase-like n=1 Tax=Uloborus diversus TaxID=327109 RepID=UPI00240A0CF4|nr:ATP synthase subunit C lysine N-methyltransferase-like [Uloborus diversus]
MNDRKRNTIGLVAVGAFGTAAVGLLVGCAPFVLPALRKICLPYVPATDNQIHNVLKILRKRRGDVIDLGSGDGRIVLAAAKLGFRGLGVELNPWLVFYSKIRAFNLGLSSHAKFKRQDIWKTDLGKFQNVIIFGVEQMMPQLEEKLKLELKENGCVIACRFPLPNWQSVAIEGAGIDTVWLYEKKAYS